MLLILFLVISQIICQIRWETCPPMYLMSNNNYISKDLSELSQINPTNDCAKIQVPLYWNNPSEKNITFFIKRLKSNQPKKGQIWMFEGGPGGSGEMLAQITGKNLWQKFNGSMDVIVPDHRVNLSF